MHLIDTHCHLDYIEHLKTEEVLKHAHDMGVEQMITVGTSPKNWQSGQQFAKTYPGKIFYTAGLHPCYVDQSWETHCQELSFFFTQTPIPVALGEIGLDFFHLPDDQHQAETIKERQHRAFRKQLELAKTLDLPIIVHSRNAFNDVVKTIDDSDINWNNVIFHCFSEGPVEVRALNERGGWASFTGIITYKKAENVRQAAIAQGLNKLILETDAPYLAPTPHRGKPNEPAYTRHIADYCASLFNTTVQQIAEISTLNAKRFFKLP